MSRPFRGAPNRRLFAVGLACLAVAALPAWGLPRKGDDWIAVRSRSFTLYSNAGRNTALRVADDLESFRTALEQVTRSLALDGRAPLRVYLFDGASFDPYRPDESRGFSVSHASATYVAINALPASGGRTRTRGAYGRFPWKDLYHEYTHFVLRNNFTNPPLWVGEGLAELYSTFDVRRSRAEVGRAIPEYLALLRAAPWFPLRDLAVLRAVPDDRRARSIFYAQSWALVHFLAWSSPERKAQLDRYLELTDSGWSPGEAFDDVWGDDLPRLEPELRRWVGRRSFRFRELALPAIPRADRAVEPMGRPETLARLGDLLVHTDPGGAEAAIEHFREAIRLDPSYAPAWTGLGAALDVAGRDAEAGEALERAHALDPGDPRPLLLHGRNLLARIERADGGRGPESAERLVRARALFARAIELDPDGAEARAALGASYLLDPDGGNAGIGHLEAARSRLPSRMDVPFNLLVLRARAGHHERAVELASEILRRSADPFLRHLSAGAWALASVERPSADRRARLVVVLDLLAAALPAAIAEPARRARIATRVRTIGESAVPPETPIPTATPTPDRSAADPRSAPPAGTR